MAKYNTKAVKEICSYLEAGLSQKDSARLMGISESTLYEWLSSKSEFSESVELAITRYKQKLVEAVNANVIKDGKLALEVLARKYPYEYGKRDILPAPKEEPNQKPISEETAKILIGAYKRFKEAEERRIEYQKSLTTSGNTD